MTIDRMMASAWLVFAVGMLAIGIWSAIAKDWGPQEWAAMLLASGILIATAVAMVAHAWRPRRLRWK